MVPGRLMNRTGRGACWWVAVAVIATASSQASQELARAQPVAGPDANPFVTLFPALRTAPAPEWLRQGTRLTYYSAAASVAGGPHQYNEDPECLKRNPPPPGGCWKDPVTGQTYQQQDIASPAGHGYTQVNVALLDRSVAVLDVRSYGIVGTNGPVELLRQFGAVGLPGAGGDFWLHPSVLRGVAEVNSPTMKILRGPYNINGRQYSSIWIQTGGQTWVYDLQSGLLLHSSASGQGAAIQGPVARGESRQGASILSQNTLVNVRTTNLPWGAAAAPDWVTRARILRYQGSAAVHVPGSPAFPTPIYATFERLGGGPNWVRYRETTTQGGSGGIPPYTAQIDRVFGPAELGGLWIAPRALGQLRTGQVVDTDPVTRVTASVGQFGRTPQGRVTVAITEVGVAHRIEYIYDAASGLLRFSRSFDQVLNAETQMRLVSVTNQ